MRATIASPSTRVGLPRWFAWLPNYGVATFVVLYLVASAVYSNGDASYDHLSHYWCDLLARTSSSGSTNYARPLALLGTCLLPVSLVPLWYHLPVLFVRGSRGCVPAQVAGVAAMVCATLVWTSFHDVALNVVAAFGFIALVAALFSIDPRRHRAVLRAAWAAGLLVFCNYVLWMTKTWPWAIAGAQKAAFLGLFVWVGVASSAIRRELRGVC